MINTFKPDYLCNDKNCKSRDAVRGIMKEYQACCNKLKEYAHHKNNCNLVYTDTEAENIPIDMELKCTCGLDKLLKELK